MTQTKAQLLDGKSATIQFTGGSASAPAISFTGDTNTGIYSPGADQVAISTNGTGRLFVNSSGNIGVGTNTPDGSLHVHTGTAGTVTANPNADNLIVEANGTGGISILTPDLSTGYLIFGSPASNEGAILRYSDSNNVFTIGTEDANGLLQFRTGAGSERMRITSDGKLGLGTSSPGANLQVVASAVDTDVFAIRRQDSASVNLFRFFQDSTITGGTGGAHLNTANRPLAITASGTAGSNEGIYIATTGNVGVGTTTPGGKFQVVTGGSGGNVLIDAEASSVYHAKVVNGSGDLILGSRNASADTCVVSNRSILFKGTSSESEVGRFDSSGRLLVGTSSSLDTPSYYKIQATAPDAAFLVLARDDSTTITNNLLGAIRFGDNGGGGNYGFGAQIDAAAEATHTSSSKPSRLVFSTCPSGSASPVERVRIGNDGTTYFGVTGAPSGSIGGSAFLAESSSRRTLYMASTTTGGTTLQVFRNPNGQVGSITTSGSATAFNTSSDYRLKENVVPVNDGITRVQQLKPSRFNFIVEPGKTVDGFIAHEVQAVVPEAIHGTKDEVDADGNPIYQGIDQSKLVPLLTAALQEAIGEIESLKARVAALETP